MWGTVLLMAVVAGLDPARIGAVAYILTRRSPMRLLVAYYVGGFGVSLIIGGVAVFLLRTADVGKSSSVPPEIEIAVGVLALVVAALVGTGVAGRARERAQEKRHASTGSDATEQATTDTASGVERLPGFEKLPQHVQNALRSESPWIAWIAGVGIGMPTAYYLAAIAAILKSGVGTGGQIGALLVFNVIAFTAVEIPLLSFLIAPDATRTRTDQLYQWVTSHQRVVITTLAGIVGIYLILIGISKL